MEEISDLERVRSFLSDDISLLEQHLNFGRERLRQQIADLTRIVEEPSALRLDPVPETSGISAPVVAAAAPAPVAPAGGYGEQADQDSPAEYAGEASGGFAGEPSSEAVPPQTPPWSREPDALRSESELSQSPVWPDHDNDDAAGETHAPAESTAVRDDFVSSEETSEHIDADDESAGEAREDGDAASPESRSVFDDVSDTGEPTQAMSGLDFGENTGDQFLDQLRRAVDDDSSLDSDAMSEFFSGDAEEGPRPRFGRRR